MHKHKLIAAGLSEAASSSICHGVNDYIGWADAYVGDDQMLGAAARGGTVMTRSGRPVAMRPRGPVPVPFGRGLAIAPGRPPIVAEAAQALQQPMPGQPLGGPRLEPIGFPAFAFTVGGPTLVTQVTLPQKAFKGSEVIAVVNRSNAGGSANGLLLITTLLIGARPVLVNRNPLPLEAYGPGSFRAQLMMDVAVPGIEIALSISISAAPTVAGDRVDVGVQINGMTWGP